MRKNLKDYYIGIISKKGKLIDFMDKYEITGLKDAPIQYFEEYINKFVAKTNLEWIRTMPEEKLAQFLSEHFECYKCPAAVLCMKMNEDYDGCVDVFSCWLKQGQKNEGEEK